IGDVTNNGTLIFNRSDASAYSGIVSGTGAVMKQGTGTLTLTGANTYTGATAITTGSLSVGTGGTTGSIIGDVTNNGTLIFNRSDASTYSGIISGTGAVTKLGGGTLTFSGSSGYTGLTSINSGVLSLSNTNALAGGGTISFGGGSLQYSASNTVDYSARILNSGSAIWIDTNGQNVTFASGLGSSNTGGLTKSGLGTLTLSGSNGYTGATTVNGGVLAYGASNVFPNSTALSVAGGSLDLGSYTNTVASFTITSGSLLGSGKLTAATYFIGGGTVASNLGAGSMTVTGNSNLNGTADVTSVSLNAGTLTLASASRFTSSVIALTGSSGGSISLGGNESVGSLAGGFNVALGSATLSTGNDNSSTTYSGILSGSGGLTKAGTGTFIISGNNTYTGVTAVSGGKLLVNGQLGNTAVTVNASGLLGGSGTILGNVTVDSSGTLSPGNSPGVLTVGSLSLMAGSTTLMEITGTAAGLYDQIVSANTIAYGGLLQLTISGSYAKDTIFELFQFTSVSGSFASLTMAGSGPYAGLTFGAIGTGGYGADAWVSDWTTPTAPNGQRLVFFQNNGTLVVIPEPSTYALLAIGAGIVGLVHRRKRRTATA
ncbi:MAG: autotransporter-associated beta strand repeat-containing protein, partial [Planctomycetota bacterium]